MRKTLVYVLTFLLLPQVMADRNENDAKIRAFLDQGMVEKALLFTEDCLKTGADKAFYLGWKLELLKIAKRTDQLIPCALQLDEADGRTKVGTAQQLAAFYREAGHPGETLRWMAQAADRGLKDPRLFGGDEWNEMKIRPGYADVHRRILDNQGIGKPAADFAARLIGGDEIMLSKFRGKVILIDFWATWCPPCVAALPSLKELHRKYQSRGFEIIGISLDRAEPALRSFLAKEPLPWPICFSGREWGGDETARLYGVEMIPVTFLVDRQGRLRFYNPNKQDIDQAIQALLAESEAILPDPSGKARH